MMNIRFWGVRGSIPTPGPQTANVGGNTSCVEVRYRDQVLILDTGTGVRRLGESLLRTGQPVEASVLFSHVHWDHIQGFPFFTPIFNPTTRLDLYGNPEDGTLHDVLAKQMTYPTFPVTLDQLPATITYNGIAPGARFDVGPFSVTTGELNHPNGSLAFRVELFDRSIVYATDTEHYRDGRIDERIVELARGADMLIYDSQYTPDQYDGHVDGVCRHGWGHSTWVEGVRVARAADVGQLVLFHHDPSSDDEAIAAIERAAAAELPETVAAREGLNIGLECHYRAEAA